MQYDNTNRGTLFRNDRKETDNHPDYNGSINVGGQEFWLNAWIKTSSKGTKFMSLSVKPKDQQPAQPQRQQPTQQQPRGALVPPGQSGFDDIEGDIPF